MEELINQLNDRSIYCLVKEYHGIMLYLFLQNCSINIRNAATNKQITVGSKVKLHLIQRQTVWNNLKINHRLFFYKLSYHLSKLIIDDPRGIVIGYHHYYYKYGPVQYEEHPLNSNVKYCYLDYSATKPLKSIKTYYISNFKNTEICKEKNEKEKNKKGEKLAKGLERKK